MPSFPSPISHLLLNWSPGWCSCEGWKPPFWILCRSIHSEGNTKHFRSSYPLPSAPLMLYQYLLFLVKIPIERKIIVLINPSFSFKWPAFSSFPGLSNISLNCHPSSLTCFLRFIFLLSQNTDVNDDHGNIQNAFFVSSPELSTFLGLFRLINRTVKGQVMELLSPI